MRDIPARTSDVTLTITDTIVANIQSREAGDNVLPVEFGCQ
ncbi:hypothetical protein [Calothrix sp. 336/3]|nr:hypothetical protein [Calothrix sp. 336/3]